jgi:hypothetical protein
MEKARYRRQGTMRRHLVEAQARDLCVHAVLCVEEINARGFTIAFKGRFPQKITAIGRKKITVAAEPSTRLRPRDPGLQQDRDPRLYAYHIIIIPDEGFLLIGVQNLPGGITPCLLH